MDPRHVASRQIFAANIDEIVKRQALFAQMLENVVAGGRRVLH
jgi:hypothetical protein